MTIKNKCGYCGKVHVPEDEVILPARYEYSLLKYCEDLHGQVTGSNGPVVPCLSLYVYWTIKQRVRQWVDDYGPTNMYDEKVKDMCRVVCWEYENEYLAEDSEWYSEE